MPRKARIDAPGAVQHIIIRGIERKPVFKDDKDRQDFLERLAKNLLDTSTPCLAWVLMNNHVHLLLTTGAVPIAGVMRRLLSGYALQFNRRHKRHGHLFQNRYKSILCEKDVYLMELVRYIHLNPIRAGAVKSLKQLHSYGYCGHSALMGRSRNEWQDMNYVLRYFGENLKSARKAYAQYVAKGVAQGRRSELVGGGLLRSVGGWSELKAMRRIGLRVMSDERILGSGDFVASVLKRADEDYAKKTKAQAKGLNLERLIRFVVEKLEVDENLLFSASRRGSIAEARSIICCLAVDKLAISGVEVACKLQLSPSAVTKLANRGRKDNRIEKFATDFFDLLNQMGDGKTDKC